METRRQAKETPAALVQVARVTLEIRRKAREAPAVIIQAARVTLERARISSRTRVKLPGPLFLSVNK